MSLLNASCHDSFGIISTDSLVFSAPEMQSKLAGFKDDPSNFIPDTTFSKGSGIKPTPPATSWQVSKIVALPHMQSIMACNGQLDFMMVATATIANGACNDIADFEKILAPKLNTAEANLHVTVGQFVGMIVGYSQKENRIMGWRFDCTDGYKPKPIEGVQYLACITPDDTELEKHVPHIGKSIAQEVALHRQLCLNQYRAYQAGKYQDGFHIDDSFQIASITHNQITFHKA